MTPLLYILMTVFILVCAILIMLILIQKGRGGGLASAFGGAGGQTAFGSKTGDVLTWATSVIFGIFVVLAVLLNLVSNHIDTVRAAGVNAVIPVNQPIMPTSPESSAPQGSTGTSGDQTPTPASTPPTSQPATPAMNPPAAPPTTKPAAGGHVPMTSLPTTLP
jgi:preprotein translocase subunit SecG